MTEVKLFDTTLRDGAQAEDVSFTVDDKLYIARLLDDFGIHYIEGGWPGSNPKDLEFFRAAAKLPLKNARIAAFGSTRRARLRAEDDPNLKALVDSGAPVACIFGKTWDLHVTEALGIELEQNLELVEDSIAFLKRHFDEVIFDAEHFFDGYKANPDYALAVLQAAARAGADYLTLCDTNGGGLPWDIEAATAAVRRAVPGTAVGIHVHNDSETAVANSLAAVRAGATLVQGTINGIGERCGNANLVSIIPGIQLKLGLRCVAPENLRKLTRLSRTVQELANLREWKNQPYTGLSAFAHKGGVHVSAVMKNAATYEHIDPELVGNRRRVLVSDLAGRSNVLYKLRELGIELDADDPVVPKVVETVKRLENEGYAYEGADASLELLVQRLRGALPEYFTPAGYRVIDERQGPGGAPVSEATVQFRLPAGEHAHTVSLGEGPVDALNGAIMKALSPHYPVLGEVHLTDYKVRILNSRDGTRAVTRVMIESSDGKSHWSTVGVDSDILGASYTALLDAITYKLYKEGV
ncbi:MAG: (R)-citramalate synthase [Gammaproteobacteria bacterium]|nr:MAG: (R)-citramalate synthase [Gammaproteobacteria bacterium]